MILGMDRVDHPQERFTVGFYQFVWECPRQGQHRLHHICHFRFVARAHYSSLASPSCSYLSRWWFCHCDGKGCHKAIDRKLRGNSIHSMGHGLIGRVSTLRLPQLPCKTGRSRVSKPFAAPILTSQSRLEIWLASSRVKTVSNVKIERSDTV